MSRRDGGLRQEVVDRAGQAIRRNLDRRESVEAELESWMEDAPLEPAGDELGDIRVSKHFQLTSPNVSDDCRRLITN